MKSAYLVGIVLSIVLGSFFNWMLCCQPTDTTGIQENKESLPRDKAGVANPFIISDNTGDFSYQADTNFNFNKSGFIIKRPVSSQIDRGVTALKSYIGNHNNKFVDIFGYYDPTEENSSAFPNLGLARANAVKNYLLSLGVSSKKLNINGLEKEALITANQNVVKGPISIAVTEDANIKDAQAVVDAIKENPIVIYFETGRSTIDLTQEQREQYLNIVRALDKIDNVSILVEGHTDQTGTADGNLLLGEKRAEFIKDYLVTNGIDPIRIQTVSKGQSEPIADNQNEQGRAQNRRIVITVN
jgi:outer membrane protein OmpA-like peptidoglycan-associated protein